MKPAWLFLPAYPFFAYGAMELSYWLRFHEWMGNDFASYVGFTAFFEALGAMLLIFGWIGIVKDQGKLTLNLVKMAVYGSGVLIILMFCTTVPILFIKLLTWESFLAIIWVVVGADMVFSVLFMKASVNFLKERKKTLSEGAVP